MHVPTIDSVVSPRGKLKIIPDMVETRDTQHGSQAYHLTLAEINFLVSGLGVSLYRFENF
jgi:hypothetical protein